MKDIDLPNFSQQNSYARSTPPIYFSKSEYDLASVIVNPASKTSYESVSFVNKNGQTEIGLSATLFDEVNTTDIPTSNFDEGAEAYANCVATTLNFLQDVAQIYGIDTRPTHQFLRRELAVFSSIRKAKDGALTKNILIKKSEQRQEFTDYTPRKKSFLGLGSDAKRQVDDF